jgi:hypothetical protein
LRKAISRALSTTICTLAIVLCVYIVSPFAGAFLLNRAIKAGDTATMNALVDWEAVKDSLRRSILTRLDEKALTRPDHPGWLAKAKFKITDAIAPMMVDSMLDERVSPEGFTTYMGPHSPKAEAARAAGIDPDTMPGADVLKRIKHAYFLDLTHFEIELTDRWDPGKVFRTQLVLSDFVWRLARVEMVSLGEGA